MAQRYEPVTNNLSRLETVAPHRRAGKLVVIDGIDQSGKRTQTNLLARKLSEEGLPVSVYEFPDYRTGSGRMLRRYLYELGERKQSSSRAVHLMFAANRWEKAERLTSDLRGGKTVVANRYSPSNIAYGLANRLPLEWLKTVEAGLPIADVTIILDIPVDASFNRKHLRRDKWEQDMKYLEKVRKAYLRLAGMFDWKVIDASSDKTKVNESIYHQLRKLI